MRLNEEAKGDFEEEDDDELGGGSNWYLELLAETTTGPAPTRSGMLRCVDVAREAAVTPRTVRNWCARGLLRCEVLPSGHRRIPAAAWEVFRAGGSRAEQDAAVPRTQREIDELDRRIRTATSADERRRLLLGEM